MSREILIKILRIYFLCVTKRRCTSSIESQAHMFFINEILTNERRLCSNIGIWIIWSNH